VTATPPIADRDSFEAELAALRVREKALTREKDAIAAARRRLPMVEVDAATSLDGPDGPVTLGGLAPGLASGTYQRAHHRRPPDWSPVPSGRADARSRSGPGSGLGTPPHRERVADLV
jgi:hypothetical protein